MLQDGADGPKRFLRRGRGGLAGARVAGRPPIGATCGEAPQRFFAHDCTGGHTVIVSADRKVMP